MATIKSKPQRVTAPRVKHAPATQPKGKIIIRKTKPYLYEQEVFGKPASFFGKKMKLLRSDGYMRQNIFGVEYIWDRTKFHISTRRARKSYKYFYIFALVRKDARAYLEENGIEKNKWLPSIHYNKNIDINRLKRSQIVGTDVDAAYWNMAYRLGIISKNTFEKGFQIPDKTLGLAALASMGSDKVYTRIKEGVPTNDKLMIKGDDNLKEVYKLIRYTCFKYMRRLAKLLGNNYVCYRTDAIYYINTAENRKIVHDFMERSDLDYKMAYELPGDDNEKNSTQY